MSVVVHDRVTERMRIDVEDGFVRILREYHTPDGAWLIDPEAGITFGQEYTDEVLKAIRKVSPKETRE